MEDVDPILMAIIEEESERTGFSVAELQSKHQGRMLTAARQYAIWRCAKETSAAVPEIAEAFNREPDAVYYSIGIVERTPQESRGEARKPPDAPFTPLKTRLPISPIIREEAERNGLTVEDITGNSKEFRFVGPRHYAMWRAVKETGRSLTEIGRAFNRDHTSVLHAYRKIENKDPELRNVYRKRLKSREKKNIEFYGDKFKGRPCVRGHDGTRYFSTGYCVACRLSSNRAARERKNKFYAEAAE